MKARLRRWSGLVFRPVAVAFDPRLQGLEHRVLERLLARLDELERHVAVDADTTAEMAITQSRLLARLEARLAALENAAGDTAPRLGGSHPVAVAWALGALAGLDGCRRVAVSAPGDPGLALALAGLGHEVLVAGAVSLPAHPRLLLDEAEGGPLDAAVILCGEGPDGPAPVPVELCERLAARLRSGGTLLVCTPQQANDDLSSPLGGARLVERLVVVPTPGGPWEVARDGSGGDGVALLRAVAER